MKPARLIAVLAALIALSLFAVACGDDDDEGSGSGSEETTQTESEDAKTVTLTAVEYEFDLSTTPTADTKTVKFQNDGEEFHVMIFARINEGFTVEEAIEQEGEGGSAVVVGEAEAPPGTTKTVQITKPLKPGSYAMLCPIGGPDGPHYELGQLQEFEIQ